ncbi:MAG: hypothetical protein ACRD23_00905 [Terriglobales bacterium]
MADSGQHQVSQHVSNPLVTIKLAHTAIWAVLAGCILALPLTALLHRFNWVVILTAIILVECGVLAVNRGRCPLTDVAARFTDERADNFDIYLPNWLASRNKTVFSSHLERCLSVTIQEKWMFKKRVEHLCGPSMPAPDARRLVR